MARNARADLFAAEAKPDVFGPEPVSAYQPNPNKVRVWLDKILAEARASQKIPWEPTTASLYRNIFLQMSLFLPAEEGVQLRLEFDVELERLEAA